jgi:predicted amino acid-binding ACT domain protein
MQIFMNTKQRIVDEIENTSEEVLSEVLNFLLFLKAKEDKEDLEDAKAALEEAVAVGTISLNQLKRELGL